MNELTFEHIGDLNDLYEAIEDARENRDFQTAIKVTHDQLEILRYLLSHIQLKPMLKG